MRRRRGFVIIAASLGTCPRIVGAKAKAQELTRCPKKTPAELASEECR